MAGKQDLHTSRRSQACPLSLCAAALSKEACTAPGGDLVNYLSVVNKQDYARLHDYVFVLGTHKADPKLENMWNKIGEGRRGAHA